MSGRFQQHRLGSMEAGLVVCALVGVIGFIWAMGTGNAVRKLERQAQAAVRSDRQTVGPSDDELESMQRLETWIQVHPRFPEQTLVAGSTPGVIELTASIQTLIHSFGERFEQEQIEVDDANFGFEDYAREVAVIADPEAAALLAEQLEAVRGCLEGLLTVNAKALVSIQRYIHSVEAPGGEQLDPSTGFRVQRSPRQDHTLRLALEWDGYTRTLRDLLQGWERLLPAGWRIVGMTVKRSDRSEPDRSSSLFETGATAVPVTARRASPFAAYLQTEAPEASVQETTPLIGEVVSRFRLVLEKEVSW
jgi:hypothetical protein